MEIRRWKRNIALAAAAVSMLAFCRSTSEVLSGLNNNTIPEGVPIATIQPLTEIPTITLVTPTLTKTTQPTSIATTAAETEVKPTKDSLYPTPTIQNNEPLTVATSTPTPAQAPTPSPIATPRSPNILPTPQNTNYPEGSINIIDILAEQADKQKEELKKSDPELYNSLNPKLLKNVSFLFSIKGTLLEKPLPAVEFWSEQLLTCQRSERKNNIVLPPNCKIIYLNHDFLATENLRYQNSHQNPTRNYSKLGETRAIGGHDLIVRQVALLTGLYSDVEVAGNSALLRDVIDNVFGGEIVINNKHELRLDDMMFEGTLYKGIRIPQGYVRLNGLQAVHIVVGNRIQENGKYNPNDENQTIIEPLLQGMLSKFIGSDLAQYGRATAYGIQLITDPKSKGVEIFPDEREILFPILSQLPTRTSAHIVVPRLNGTIYVGADNAGGVGGQWPKSSLSTDVQNLLKAGRLNETIVVPAPYPSSAKPQDQKQIVILTEPIYHPQVLYGAPRESLEKILLSPN